MRTGTIVLSQHTDNQCKQNPTHIYDYECKILFGSSQKLDEQDFLIEHDKICAILHDYPEDVFDDPDVAFKLLRGYGFDEDDIRVLDLLTHRKSDDYLTVYIKKIATCPRATRIKLKDLEHNSNISRLKDFSKKSFDNLEKYHIAFQYLSKIK